MALHLKFPKRRGFLSCEEQGCLARALGFPTDLFAKALPTEYTTKENGISIRNLFHLMDFFKYLNEPLDRTCNIHTDEWNLNVIKRTVQLLDSRVFSFGEVQSVRIAYQVYESPDTKGLLIDEWILLRALKMCGRTISPLKMMHRIKHMRDDFEEADRIQLHEFFDLLLWCESYEEMEYSHRKMDLRKDEREMYKMEEFDEVLTHHDERLAVKLNQIYHQEEWRFTKEKHSSKKLPKDIPPVDAEIRRKQVRRHQTKYRQLQAEIGRSQNHVVSARAGYVRARPLSAPDLNSYDQEVEFSETTWTTGEERPQTVYEITRHLYAPSANKKKEVKDIIEEVPRPPVTEYVRTGTPVAVTEEDVVKSENFREALDFDIKTSDQKYERYLYDNLDAYLPKYRSRMANRPPAPPTPEPTPSPVPKTPRSEEETVKDLSDIKRPVPAPSHRKSCDARFRGWFVTKARRGPHVIVTGPTYDDSPTGRLLNKMHHHNREQGKGEDYAYRYTKKSQVDPSSAQVYNHSILSTMAAEDAPESHIGDSVAKQEGTPTIGAESVDSKRPNTTQGINPEPPSELAVFSPTPKSDDGSDGSSDYKWKSRASEKRKKGSNEESGLVFGPARDLKAEEKIKEKIEIRGKLGRVEVLEEIEEKGEEEETRGSNSWRSVESRSKAKQRKSKSKEVENLEVVRTTTSQMSEASIPSMSSKTGSESSVPFSREVSRLAHSGPKWLTDMIMKKNEPKELAFNKNACHRLARRLGNDIGSELRSRLLSSTC